MCVSAAGDLVFRLPNASDAEVLSGATADGTPTLTGVRVGRAGAMSATLEPTFDSIAVYARPLVRAVAGSEQAEGEIVEDGRRLKFAADRRGIELLGDVRPSYAAVLVLLRYLTMHEVISDDVADQEFARLTA
jgi:hypothetical protein